MRPLARRGVAPPLHAWRAAQSFYGSCAGMPACIGFGEEDSNGQGEPQGKNVLAGAGHDAAVW